MDRYDVAVVGGGCVGCSVAWHVAERSELSVAVLEKEYHLAAHQSGRNSGVLHPGFNYPPDTLKARFATEGTARLKAFAAEHDVPLAELGVVVVAQDDGEVNQLERLHAQAEANGVETEIVDADRLAELEPHAEGIAALHCPSAASIDSQQYVYALAREAEAAGVDLYRGAEVRGLEADGDGVEIETSAGRFEAEFVVNAAGLYADTLAHELGVGEGYRIIPFRGEYYELVPDRAELCRSMIYPTPDPELPFLGVHYTRRTDGKVIAGPNAVLAFGREAYRNTDVDLREFAGTLGYRGFWRLLADRKMLGVAVEELGKSYRKSKFVASARRLVPGVTVSDFRKSYDGIRAQLVSADGELVKDPMFVDGPRSLHVLNAVSPGLTSSLPFGDHLADRVVEAVDG